MKSNESMEVLFTVINKISGPIAAKKAVSNALFNIISDLQEEGLSVTGEAIETRLVKVANDFLAASKKTTDAA